MRKQQFYGWLIGVFYFFTPAFAEAYVSIDVGKARIRESQMAIQPLFLSGPSSASALKGGNCHF